MTADAVARFPDEETRRQIREELKATFLVEAGAGTGKTSALVERVVALVLGGRLIERIVAITFTEKAAAELRDRVRSGLEAREADTALSDGERKLLRQALNSIDRAPISTIHAFCQSLLRQFAPTLGIDPAFELQDEVLADRRFEEMWRLRLDSMGEDGDARAAVHRALNLGMLTRDIATLAQSLWQQPEFAPILLASPLTAPEVAWPNVGDIIRRLRGLGTVVLDSSDNLWVKIQALIVRLEEVARAGADREARLAELASLLALNYGTGRQGNWGGPGGVGAARETTQDVVSALNQTLDVLREQALAAVLRYVVAFVVDDTRARGREGKLVFDDLILQTRELLETNPDARRAVRERFDCMLIDEFQDTDPVQVQVARAFATESGSDTPDAGRLFLVGDPKQSIYRFRRADMASYSQTRSAIEAQDGRLPLLEQNRRSRDVIIGWVNAVFEGLIGPGANPAFQPPYHAIEPSRSVVLAGPGVAWFGDGAAMPARDVRAAEVRELAALVRGVVDEAWEVEDRATSAVRPATFRDLAILLPTRTILLQLERALQDAGVPYRVEGGSLVYGTQD
ncbi:MAG TPA: UvrD-helicase domain-containing protein, partial [Dehalococcoidia bacterium]